MKLRLPVFEKRVKRQVRKRLRELPAQRAEARRLWRRKWFSGHHVLHPIFSKLVFGLAIGAFVMGLAKKPEFALALMAVFLVGPLLNQTHGFLSRLLWNEIALIHLFPRSDLEYLHWQLKNGFWATLGMLLIAGPVYAVLAFELKVGGWGIFGVIIASCLQVLLMISTILLLASRRPQWRYGQIGGGINFFGIITFVLIVSHASSKGAEIFQGPLELLPSTLLALLPTGWINLFFLHFVLGHEWSGLYWLLPVFLLASTLPSSVARMRSWCDALKEPALENEAQFSTDGAIQPAADAKDGLQIKIAAKKEEMTGKINGGILNEEVLWKGNGAIERIIYHFFTEREKRISRLMLFEKIQWTASWKFVVKIFLFLLILSMGFHFFSPEIRIIAIGIPCLFVVFLIFGTWSGFEAAPGFVILVPGYAFFPVGFWEITRMMFKVCLVNTVAFASIILGCGYLLSDALHLGVLTGFIYGIKGLLVILAAQFFIMTFSFSGSSNDTQKISGFLILPLFLSSGLIFLSGAVALFWVPPRFLIFPVLGTALVPIISHSLYGLIYNRAKFDLAKVFRQTVSE